MNYSTTTEIPDNQKDIWITNNVDVNNKKANSSWNYKKHDGTQSKQVWDSGTDQYTWRVHALPPSGRDTKKLTISDTIPEYLDLDLSTLQVSINKEDGTSNVKDIYKAEYDPVTQTLKAKDPGSKAVYTVRFNEQTRILEVTLEHSDGTPLDKGTKFMLDYTTTVNRDKLVEELPDEKSHLFKNEAKIRYDDLEVPPVSASKTWHKDPTQGDTDKIDKEGKWDQDNQRLDYQILLNGDGQKIVLEKNGEEFTPEMLTVIDKLTNAGYNDGDRVQLVYNSVKLYKGDTVKDSAEVSAGTWKWTETEELVNGSMEHRIEAEIPNDGSPYVLTYSYTFRTTKKEKHNLRIRNEASISGTGFKDKDSQEQIPWDESHASGVIEADGLDIHKVDGENHTIRLPGVKFDLYVWNGTEYEYIENDTFVTDEKGMIMLPPKPMDSHQYHFESNTAYYLEESKSADGYINGKTRIYFYYPDKNSTVNMLPNDDFLEKAHALGTDHVDDLIIKNFKGKSWSIRKIGVNKEDQIVADQLAGAQFQLQVWNGTEFVPVDKFFTTDESGTIDITWESIPNAKYNLAYQLVETKAPDGYEMIGIDSNKPNRRRLYFYFGSDDKISNPESYPGGWEWDQAKVDVMSEPPERLVENRKTVGLKIEKVSGITIDNPAQTPLPGAEFKLQKWNGTTWEDANWTITTNDKGLIEYKEENFQQYQDIALRFIETKAPEGYSLPEKVEPVNFYCSNKDPSSISKPEGFNGINIHSDYLHAVVDNYPSGFHIKKKWEKNGEPFEPLNTSITVDIYRSAECKAKVTVIEGDNGRVLSEKEFIPGTPITVRFKSLGWNVGVWINDPNHNYQHHPQDFDGPDDNRTYTHTFYQDVIIHTSQQFIDLEVTSPEGASKEFFSQVTLSKNTDWHAFIEAPNEEIIDGKKITYTYSVVESKGPSNFEVTYVNNVDPGDQETVEIQNTFVDNGVELPETGSIGPKLLMKTGTALIVLASMILLIKRICRKEGDDS